MSAKYKPADKAVRESVAALIKENHTELGAIGVTVDLIFAYAAENEEGEKTAPALKCHGYPANGIARIVGLKDRVMGRSDCEILLDGDRWPDLKVEQRDALLDHELYHFVVKRNAEGGVLYDTNNRPKLTMRLHDREMGWFDIIAKRHGAASSEVTQAVQIFEEAGQIYFPFAKVVKGTNPRQYALEK